MPGARRPGSPFYDSEGEVLFGWAKIAEHLGVSEMTAKRFVKVFGMPVVKGVTRQVFTYPMAIALWVQDLSLQGRKIEAEIREEAERLKREKAGVVEGSAGGVK